jgi:hypothetical protein
VWDCSIELLDVNDQGARWRIEDDRKSDREVGPVVEDGRIGFWLHVGQSRELKVFNYLRESEVDVRVSFDFGRDRCDHVLLVLFDDLDPDLLANGHQFRICEKRFEGEDGGVVDRLRWVIESEAGSEVAHICTISIRGDVELVSEVNCERLSLVERKFVEVEVCC